MNTNEIAYFGKMAINFTAELITQNSTFAEHTTDPWVSRNKTTESPDGSGEGSGDGSGDFSTEDIFPNSTVIISTTTLDFGSGEVTAVGTRIGLGIVMCFIISIAIVGNSLVLLAIMKTRSLQRLNNFLLVSLAFSDFFSAVLCMPLFITELFSDYKWPLPEGMCSFYISLELSFIFLSVWNIAAIALERVSPHN